MISLDPDPVPAGEEGTILFEFNPTVSSYYGSEGPWQMTLETNSDLQEQVTLGTWAIAALPDESLLFNVPGIQNEENPRVLRFPDTVPGETSSPAYNLYGYPLYGYGPHPFLGNRGPGDADILVEITGDDADYFEIPDGANQVIPAPAYGFGFDAGTNLVVNFAPVGPPREYEALLEVTLTSGGWPTEPMQWRLFGSSVQGTGVADWMMYK